ncbi:MAG: phytanoyl-CoA dioxygenase [Puniceicoccaceae bacterium]|nr:MAG: phytanoyl-CoA dioxygenase [Puniceicoccaceae bacterium]
MRECRDRAGFLNPGSAGDGLGETCPKWAPGGVKGMERRIAFARETTKLFGMTSASPAVAPCLSSLGRLLPVDERRFGWMEPSNELLDDPGALRERLAAEGYLYFKRFLPVEAVLAGRRSILSRLAAEGLLDPGRDLMEGVLRGDLLEAAAAESEGHRPLRRMKAGAFRPDLARANSEIERVVYGPELQAFYDRLFGEPALHFDFTWLRVMGPGYGTPTHCDWVYMGRGSTELLTCWVPYGEVPLEVGGLMVLERSHLQAERIRPYLDKDVDTYCENRPADVKRVKEEGGWSFPGWLTKNPQQLPDKFQARWLTCRHWEPGDFITFSMRMIHGSLDNASDRLRISTDVRYQPASQPADERWVGPNPPAHGRAGKRGRIC